MEPKLIESGQLQTPTLIKLFITLFLNQRYKNNELVSV